ncbi:glycosyltransferase, partial [Candidatus Latescibacterota bacterium]
MIEKEDKRLIKNELDLTISIVNTNNKDMLRSCLLSIYDTTKKTSFEVIVADNSSTDGSIEMIKEFFPDVIITSIIPRNGYGFCHNRAYEKSQGRYFLLLNEDMIILPKAIDTMVKIIKKDKMIGALG